jgi:UPF0716 protein FxsA
MWLFIALIGVPLIEIALFIEVGGWIGLWPTILLVIVTAVAGGWMLRRQGLGTLRRLQAELERGGDPSRPLAHGAMLLFAGALLLTPGFFTDAVGFTLLSPAARDRLIAWAGPRVAARALRAGAGGFGAGPAAPRPAPGDPGEQPIEADYRRLDEREPRD